MIKFKGKNVTLTKEHIKFDNINERQKSIYRSQGRFQDFKLAPQDKVLSAEDILRIKY